MAAKDKDHFYSLQLIFEKRTTKLAASFFITRLVVGHKAQPL